MTINSGNVIAVNWKDVTPEEQYKGFRVRPLWSESSGRKALVFEIDPGCVYPILDTHILGAEEVFIVSGTFSDGITTYSAGTFIHNPKGSSHVPQSIDGCVLFVYYPEG